MDKKTFLAELEMLLELDSGALRGTEALEDIEQWDSLAVISFIAMVDERMNIVVEGEALSESRTIEDLYRLVEQSVAA